MSTAEERRDLDVSGLPSVTFGPKSLLWWGTLGFIVIEGFTVVLTVAAYLYLRLNERNWPPEPTPLPDLLIPTINTVLILLLIVPMYGVEKAAKRFDRGAVTKGFAITTLLTIPVLALRWFDIEALNAWYDTNAYASAAWAVVVLHGLLVLFDFLETAAMTVLFYIGHAQKKHYSDASDAALYQYYLSLAWVPLYLIIYWGPRFL